MFEINAQDIAQLDDKQLRELVARLCEADLQSRGYSTAAVTWGGDQNAKDGGLDVRVSLPPDRPIDGFIPCGSTGFQVKKSDMPPNAITAEMRPNGELRPAIRELGDIGGAYIIVSSHGSTADTALTNRKKAMSDATRDLAQRPALDFYDRTRLAAWVRCHAGITVWVRQQIGRAIPGWEPFGAWAYPAGGLEAGYLLEKGVRIRRRAARADDDLSAEEGLKEIRRILNRPASVVRLVGLSGVGKTRFAQALFDDRVKNDALDPALAIYTNMNNEPNPQPFNFVSDLIMMGRRAIVIVDNCAPDLHTRLAGLVGRRTSPVSVLTVEYDIRDDQPEGTEVFEVKAGSIDLIVKLLEQRFPGLSQVDGRTAAEFSGGNARIAIALADTVSRGGTLASLSHRELFERLFVQRQHQDRQLLEIAQACALVYSFSIEDTPDVNETELGRIARLVEATTDQAHRDIAELLRRDLAQRRGRWRAILPHALANYLAETALQNISFPRIKECLLDGAPERLTISFSRRLGYLNGSPEATAIVNEWLDPEGWIGKHLWNLSEFGRAVFENCLSASPEAGLQAIEVNVPRYDADTPICTGHYLPRALRSLAWDAELFDRCTALLQVLATYGEDGLAKTAAKAHTSLFYLYLSGTHATARQRAVVVGKLLNSLGPNERDLGIAALDAMLEAWHFSSDYNFQFGSRSRDYGYEPKTSVEQTDWYKIALATAAEFAHIPSPIGIEFRRIISNKLRGLWRVGLHDEIENFFTRIAEQNFWPEGWLAVKQARFYDAKDKVSENYSRLTRLEQILGPRDLAQRVRGLVFAHYDVEQVDLNDHNKFSAAMERQKELAKTLGREVASNTAVLRDLMPEIVGSGHNLWDFGSGLCQGSNDLREIWVKMVLEFAETPIEQRDVRAFCGFLQELQTKNPQIMDELLDQALGNEPLSSYFPQLQSSVDLTSHSMARLMRCIEVGNVPVHQYSYLNLGRAVGVVPAAEIAACIIALSNAPNARSVACQVLGTLFLSERQSNREHAPELVAAGCHVLEQMTFDRSDRQADFHRDVVARVCLADHRGQDVAKAILNNLKQALAEHRTSLYHHNELLKALFIGQPRAALEALFSTDNSPFAAGRAIVMSSDLQQNPLDEVSESFLLEWCAENPTHRFPAIASVVTAFTLTADQTPANWTPISTLLVHRAPDPIAVMGVLVARLRPMTWSGSKSTILESGARLLDQFDAQGNLTLAAFIAAQRGSLQREARQSLNWETRFDRDRDERFE